MNSKNPQALNLLQKYVSTQVNNLFPPLFAEFQIDLKAIEISLIKIENSISAIKVFENQDFNYLHSGQYATFLYFLSRYLAVEKKDFEGATKLFLLNKALNGIDLFYDIRMSDLFLIGHTVGMVFAKAEYGPYCVFHQGCTVGRNLECRPKLGAGVVMYPHSSVIGNCNIGENTVISPGVQIINSDTPGNCIVFQGPGRDLIFKDIVEIYAKRYFNF